MDKRWTPVAIVKIGRQDVAFTSLDDAIAVLKLLNAAQFVESDYIGEPGHDFRELLHFVERPEVSLRMHPGAAPISAEEFESLRAEAYKARKARNAAAGAEAA